MCSHCLAVAKEVANSIFDHVDVDGSGDIDQIEWVAWLRTTNSQSKSLQKDAKIVVGLWQVLSQQPARSNHVP